MAPAPRLTHRQFVLYKPPGVLLGSLRVRLLVRANPTVNQSNQLRVHPHGEGGVYMTIKRKMALPVLGALLVMGMIGGCMFPRLSMPPFMKQLGLDIDGPPPPSARR